MVGTGVFTSLGFQVLGITSGFSLLLIWFVGGIFALCGALSYAELGAALPRSGGEFNYLSRIFHPSVGFVSGWVSSTVGFAAPIALAAMALGDYFTRVFPDLDKTVIAVVVVVMISLVHMQNVKFGSYFQNIFTVLKVLLILFLIIAGFTVGENQGLSFAPSAADLDSVLSMPFAVSLVYVMYAYSGWNASTYIAAEVKDPGKNLPRSLFIGTAVVMVLYVLLNFVFLYTTPISAMAGQVDVGYVASYSIFGEGGGRIMGMLISLALISSISSMIWAGPRVTQVIGEDIPFFKTMARTNKAGIPTLAILVQMAIALLLATTSSFDAVIKYTIYTLILSSFTTVLGVFVFRIRHPQVQRPYKTWGYPITPIIFLAISLWMLIYVAIDDVWQAVGGFATIISGLVVYFITRPFSPHRPISQEDKF
ncbi:MAG: amino acid permease [Bacteroidia bacterium]|nr:amino acid permease [Bacteroidia bacterium]